MRGRHNGPRNNNKQTNWRQTFDSNGPDVRIRGNAVQVYEKYQNLARDASTAGDRIAAESYYQHAEHYYRILMADQQARERHQRQLAEQREAEEGEFEQDAARPPEPGEEQPDIAPPPKPNGRRDASEANRNVDGGEAEGQPDVEAAEGGENGPKPRRRGRPRKPKPEGDGPDASPNDSPPS
ncbi:MAG: DUF4167 domain-containing protein [Pseudomonadota bacterium]